MLLTRYNKRQLTIAVCCLLLSVATTRDSVVVVAQNNNRQEDDVIDATATNGNGTEDAGSGGEVLDNGDMTMMDEEDEDEENGNAVVHNNDTAAGDGFMNDTIPIPVPDAISTESPSSTTTQPACYDNLRDVYTYISDDEKLFEQKQFIICPGTVIDVGFLVPGVGLEDGQEPIVPRSNSEYLCGVDGSSDNNCIIRGGDFGVVAVPVFFRQDLSVYNVVVKGFIFEGQNQYAAFMAVPGDVSFIDCVFRDQANFGTIVANYDSRLDLGGRRLIKEVESEDPFRRAAAYIQNYHDHEEEKESRKLEQKRGDHYQAVAPVMNTVTRKKDRSLQKNNFLEFFVRGCRFERIEQIERQLGVEFGVVTVKTRDIKLVMEDTIFSDIKFGNQELTPIGYGLLVQKAELEIHNVCFLDNEFRGFGTVLLEQTADPFAPGANFLTNNYATETDPNVECSFAAYFATDEDRRNGNATCVPVQIESCQAGAGLPETAVDDEETGSTTTNDEDTSSTNGDGEINDNTSTSAAVAVALSLSAFLSSLSLFCTLLAA